MEIVPTQTYLLQGADVADHFVLNKGMPLDSDKAALFRCTALSRIRVVTNSGHVRSGDTQGPV